MHINAIHGLGHIYPDINNVRHCLLFTMGSDTMGQLPIVHYDNCSIVITNRSKGPRPNLL